jgi:hypothetical protein
MFAIVTLDLCDAKKKNRDIFYEYLKEETWEKYKSDTTTWSVEFENDNSEDAVISVTKEDLGFAALESSITDYYSVITVCETKPIEIDHNSCKHPLNELS